MSGYATAASIIVTVATTAVTMYAQQQQQEQQAKAQKAQAAYNAQIAANEAATQEQLARNEISKGIADRERQQRDAAAVHFKAGRTHLRAHFTHFAGGFALLAFPVGYTL